ncbi:MAG: DNA-binding protein, partial [Winkia neuii]|nr:DNA-binding protein [Winkia neuii]
WMALLLMALVFAIMMGIRKHYRTANEELEVPDYQGALALPSRVHAVVLVSNLHQPAMRAISYARATSPSTLELLTVDIDPDSTRGLKEQWKASAVPVPLTVLASPFRDITGPVVQYVRNLRKSSPRDLVVVYIPEYLVAHWWESALHNHSATRLRVRLQFVPGVVMATVPWQLTGAYDHVAKPGANSTINPPEQSRKEA